MGKRRAGGSLIGSQGDEQSRRRRLRRGDRDILLGGGILFDSLFSKRFPALMS